MYMYLYVFVCSQTDIVQAELRVVPPLNLSIIYSDPPFWALSYD